MKNPPSQTYVNIGSALLITFLEKTNYQLPFPGQRSAEPVLDASNVTVSAEPVDEAQKEEDDAEKPVVPQTPKNQLPLRNRRETPKNKLPLR